MAVMRAQSSQADVERIDALRGQIANGVEQHATDAQLGGLWLRLANRYQHQLEFAEAEDAFGHALRLLRTGAAVDYADALDGIGSLHLATGRLSEAESESRRALDIYKGLGDGARVARLHETMAIALLIEQKFSDSEAESTEALRVLRAQARPDLSEEVAEHLTHSYSLCYQGRCRAALDENNEAMKMAQEAFAANSMEMVGVWLARGFEEWKAGSPDKGEEAMREALTIVRGRTDLPPAIRVSSQMDVMRQYAACLKASHRKPEAKLMEMEIARLQRELLGGCGGSTVNVAALGKGSESP
jgi:tetratricopeptide (TPR) repeat protein